VPGDLVEVDTPDVRRWPGLVFKHFTARDVISRWDKQALHLLIGVRISVRPKAKALT
jgi:hypothetical protein